MGGGGIPLFCIFLVLSSSSSLDSRSHALSGEIDSGGGGEKVWGGDLSPSNFAASS